MGVSETVLMQPIQPFTPVLFITGLMCERALYVAKGLRRYRVADRRGQISRSRQVFIDPRVKPAVYDHSSRKPILEPSLHVAGLRDQIAVFGQARPVPLEINDALEPSRIVRIRRAGRRGFLISLPAVPLAVGTRSLMMLGVFSVLVLAFQPMHSVVLTKALQLGTPTRLARRSVVLVKLGGCKYSFRVTPPPACAL